MVKIGSGENLSRSGAEAAWIKSKISKLLLPAQESSRFQLRKQAGDNRLTSDDALDEPASGTQAPVARRLRNGRRTALQPLTHHEIMRLIEPFIRRGHHVDLQASQRIERRLTFKPISHDSDTPAYDGACERLELENLQAETYRLTRTLTLRCGAAAKLTTEGEDLGALLDRLGSVPLQRLFQWVGAIPIAQSYRLTPAAGSEGAAPHMALTAAEARLDGLTFALNADTGRGYPAEIELTPQAEHLLDLPDDLLAALGWDWRVLRRRGTMWRASVRAPSREPGRSRRIEAASKAAVAHLARTLAEPPRRFHERFRWARWAVVFRRTIPLLFSLVLLVGGLALTLEGVSDESPFRMLLFNFPPVLLLVFFSMRELPRFEIPPLPRPSRAPSWRKAQNGAGGPGA
ncbi:hypothetical protein [Rhodoblastus acidophilus]|uniref:hypothetical protein n=1 Tax=Rhodoblastus acidophilus TaxID=1074 RepID=UPI001130D7C6|nr:hypothetical protein [Rhodoblastus acidophilus]